ncbi:hypothetical protein HanIR_Chr01g0044011 [Helianthus annuus]|nr:hypothetical protein HanIR_Chr01g0044011 [Helianthus annuus]
MCEIGFNVGMRSRNLKLPCDSLQFRFVGPKGRNRKAEQKSTCGGVFKKKEGWGPKRA